MKNNNNRSERAIMSFAIARKDWLFADSVAGAEVAAILFSLYDWFRYVLKQLPLCQYASEIEKLLSFYIDQVLLGR